MFLSWKPSSEANSAADTNHAVAFDPVTAKTQVARACSNCRARKLKCVWDGGGCERCRTMGRKCIYESTSNKTATNTRRRTRHGGSDTSTGTSTKWTEPEQAANPSSFTSPSDTTTSQTAATTQPGQSSAVNTADKGSTACESCGTSSNMFSVDAQFTPESMFFNGGDMDMINLLAMDMDTDGETVSGQWQGPNLDVTMGLEAEDDITLAMKQSQARMPCAFAGAYASPPTTTSGHAPKTNHERPRSESGGLCGCLVQVVHLVEEIDSLVETDGLKSLDSALAAHKEALGCGTKMLRCQDCTGRTENLIMLTLMVDKLVRMCKDVSEACCAGLRTTSGTVDTNVNIITSHDIQTSRDIPLLTLQNHNDNDSQQQKGGRGAGSAGGTTTPSSKDTRVYSVDSSAEYLFVVAGILRFQLLQLFNLTEQLRRVTAPLVSDRISQRIKSCSEAIMEMMYKAGFTPCEALGFEEADATIPSWLGLLKGT